MNLVLTLNGGSSSIKFALHRIDAGLQRTVSGRIERIGLSGTSMSVLDHQTRQDETRTISGDFSAAVQALCEWLEQQVGLANIQAVVHRVVHGMQHEQPALLTPTLLQALQGISPYDPEHMPGEIQLIQAMLVRAPQLKQVLCFDTAFHQVMPAVAKRLPLPRRYQLQGVQRYGFHGLSYSYLLHKLQQSDAELAPGRLVLAHLGNGASMAAIKSGQCMDTTMGFTPTGGLVMGTRSGDLDPGVAWYLFNNEQLTPSEFSRLVNHESGLLGISETSSDMRDLLALENSDARAAEAIELFCYQARKQIGAYAAALGGLDGVVFTGGIGEHCALVRARICTGLEFLGIELDTASNVAHAAVASAQQSQVKVLVLPTDEEWMMARQACELLGIAVQS